MPSVAELAKRLNDAAGLRSLNVPDFIALLRDTFRHAGLSEADASIAADVAAHGTLHGSDAHGAVQMPLYVAGLVDGIAEASKRRGGEGADVLVVLDDQDSLLAGRGRDRGRRRR